MAGLAMRIKSTAISFSIEAFKLFDLKALSAL
jgi:hypothetical protein